MESTNNAQTRSDHEPNRKRIKLESFNQYPTSLWTTGNHSPFSITATIRELDELQYSPFPLDSLHEQTSTPADRKSCLETLPNELLLSISGHLQHTDLVQSFRGLNRRFDQLVCDQIRRFTVPRSTSVMWFVDQMKHVEHAIESLTLDFELVPRVFPCTYSYPNLRSVILKNYSHFTLNLKVDDCCALAAIISSVDLLRSYSAWMNEVGESVPFFGTDSMERTADTQMDTFFNTLPCPAIRRLTAVLLEERDAIYLCGRMPNLTELRIQFEALEDDDDPNFPAIFSTAFVNAPSQLTKLHLRFCSNQLSLNTLQWLLSSSYRHLKEFRLHAGRCDFIDGKQLEKLLQSCEKLTKIAFNIDFVTKSGIANTADMLRQFQTDWWLDASRPSVFVHHSPGEGIHMLSMPSSFIGPIDLPHDPKLWPFNKGPYNSPEIFFRKVAQIHLVDKKQLPITLDLVRLLEHLFRAPRQFLRCDYWEFASPYSLYQWSSNGMVMLPQLPLVRRFCASYSNCDKLSGVSLVLWLLIAPNVVELTVEDIPTELKLKLAKELDQWLHSDTSVAVVFDRIKKVWLFSSHDKSEEKIKMEIFFLFLEMFPNAVIHHL